jgi:L-serine deaminase
MARTKGREQEPAKKPAGKDQKPGSLVMEEAYGKKHPKTAAIKTRKDRQQERGGPSR